MPITYEPIATTTLGSAAANIDFTSIPSTYTDLRLVLVVRSDRASTVDSVNLRFNSDTTTSGSQTTLLGDGSTAQSFRSTSVSRVCNCNCPADTSTAGIFGLIEYNVFSYAGSTNKTVLAKTSADRNELIGQIYLQPTKTAEFIYLDFNITPTGATFPA